MEEKVKRQRRTFTAEFKSEVALEALRGEAGVTELGRRHGIHPNLILEWRKSLRENCHRLFEEPHPEKDGRDRLIESQNREIGRLTEDADFLKKKLGPYL